MAGEKKDTDKIGGSGEKAGTATKELVAATPRARAVPEELQPVTELAAAAGVRPWELAGLMRAAGWAEGKQCSPSVFSLGLNAFRNRPQGGGRIAI